MFAPMRFHLFVGSPVQRMSLLFRTVSISKIHVLVGVVGAEGAMFDSGMG